MLVLVFLVTSSDSGSLVIDAITAGGKTEAPTAQQVSWATTGGRVAIVLLIGRGMTGLQAMVSTSGIFVTAILPFLCRSIREGLRTEPSSG